MSKTEDKEILRKKYRRLRMQLDSDERAQRQQELFRLYQQHFAPAAGSSVHIFLPIIRLKEIDTHPFIRYFHQNGIQVFVPKMKGDTLLTIRLDENSRLALNTWGIEEPVSDTDEHPILTQVLTPLLYADPVGNRIGYGKGFYDRFFATLPETTLKIGLNYFPPKELIANPNPLDVPLDYLISPEGIVSFTG